MDFCPKCGSMILHGTKCGTCGFDSDGFYFEKLKIGIPNQYISDKNYLRENYDELLKLIVNRDEIKFTKNDLIQHLDKIINVANENFIKKERKTIRNKFTEELNSFDEYIDDEKRSTIKNKYTKSYYNYYDVLKMDLEINKFNEVILNKEKQKIYDDLEDKYISYSEMIQYKQNNDIKFDLSEIVNQHNNDFIKNQMVIDKDFFDNFDGKTLDDNQRIAVLTDDDNTQIVAGAGTGKTLTIQAKVKYLIDKKGIDPEDILCISFSNSARDDLANRLEKTSGNVNIEVKTFHSLGYKILGINDYDKEVPKYDLIHLIDDYFKDYYINKPQEVIEFFSYYYNLIHINSNNLKLETIKSKLNSLDEYDEYLLEYLKINDLKRKKEYMYSIPELIVANYLFIHNIAYEKGKQLIFKNHDYDKQVSNLENYLFLNESKYIPKYIKTNFIKEFLVDYENDFAFKEFEEYPNFFLPDYNIYIDLDYLTELESENNLIKHKEKIENYKKWNELNKICETKYFAFKYDDNVESLINDLEEKLIENSDDIIYDVDWDILFNLLILKDNLPEYHIFIKTIERFINYFKGNAKNINDFGEDISKEVFNEYLNQNQKLFSESIVKRNNFFLKIISKIYELYKQHLGDDYIDFNDMINEAIIKLKKGGYIHEYKYIIVDEYQDTSYTRYCLLKEVQKATGAKLVVVGDDWQSIYGFTGCDVNLFSKFENYFPHPKRVIIDVTRRNSQELINVIGDFIQENKNQIPKKLLSEKHNDYPIKIFEYNSRAEEVLAFINILNDIAEENKKAEILVLGRNNKDINEILCKELFSTKEFQDFTQITYEENKDLSIEFRTIHKSKGLQSDYVIVLNVNDQINGFPNKIVNDPILDFVNNTQDEDMPYPEERRLFYVALTRTKNDVYLFNRSVRPSEFIYEIINKNNVEKLKYIFSNEDILKINSLLEKKMEVIETKNTCPDCNVGKVNLIVNNERGTSYFRCSNFCGWNGGSHHNKKYGDNSRYISYVHYAEVCSECGGMLIVKNNRQNGTKFLGCNFYRMDGLGCNNSKSLPWGFELEYEPIFNLITEHDVDELKKTRNGVYYIKEYVPEDKREDYDKDYVDFSEMLIQYKNDKDEYSLNLFTKQLMTFISKIFDNHNSKLALIAVPSSKVKKSKNSIKKSISLIKKWYDLGRIKSEFNCNNEIINYNELLKRVIDVPTAHKGEGRASCDEHVDSMECMEDKLSNENIVYIVLDDITTTGNSMRACNELLLNSGVKSENIYNIALGATVRDDDEEI